MKKIRRGSSPAILALLAIPLALGVAAYAAGGPLLNGLMGTDVSHECCGMHDSMTPKMYGAGHGDCVRQRLKDQCECHTMDREMMMLNESQETISLEGVVTEVVNDTHYIKVEDANGTTYTVVIGGKWMDESGNLIPYYELQAKIAPGTSVSIVGFTCCEGCFRATEIVVNGVTYTWQTCGTH